MKKIMLKYCLCLSALLAASQSLAMDKPEPINGEKQAQIDYALKLFLGDGVKRNTKEGLRLIEEAVDPNLPEASYTLGLYYFRAELRFNRLAKRTAKKRDQVFAQGLEYEKKAEEYFAKADATPEKSEKYEQLANKFQKSAFSMERQWKKSIADYKKNNEKALGYRQLTFEFVRKAAMSGHIEAQATLGMFYYDNYLNQGADQEKGLELINKAADQGSEYAQKYLVELAKPLTLFPDEPSNDAVNGYEECATSTETATDSLGL